ncbi:Uu.00g037760.m01.CDS01 [Anthostomella pinea]|uniref:Uu.00g037760.m01.CDS01 n=1 Tax=Anthostomella pinea TaxID=933095 RepID=A0AAI8V9S9_9PEZI|nr:Uu.00g037760.m01.CDS01 [Anthostomella pinea]
MALRYFTAIGLFLSCALAGPLSTAGESNHLSGRAFAINEDGSSTLGRPWPNAKIVWCFEPDGESEDKDSYKEVLKIAKGGWKLWEKKLDGRSKLKFEPSDKKKPSCKKDHGTMLRITFNNQGSTSSHTGFKADARNMKFDPGNKYGGRDPVVIFAHELGHVFGLQHEHQKPSAWKKELPLLKLNCENMLDYEASVRKFGAYYVDNTLCTDEDKANRNRFSAHNFLPLTFPMGLVEDDSFDWDSIMMYDSLALSKDPHGGKLVLVAANGGKLKINNEPSKQDVAAVAKLYPK